MTDTGWIEDLGLSELDRHRLFAMLQPNSGSKFDAASLAPMDLWEHLACSVKVYATAKLAQAQLKPIIGKLLIAVQDHPELYQARGYRTYDDFITRGCREMFGLPRSEAYRSKRLVEAWPNLTPGDFVEIGEKNLYALSSFTNSSDPASTGWLEIARSSTLDQLKDRIVQRSEGTADGLTPVQISFVTNLEVKKAWTSFVSNSAVQSTVGSADPGQILMAAVGEAVSSWGV
jgi:hypothetical protein